MHSTLGFLVQFTPHQQLLETRFLTGIFRRVGKMEKLSPNGTVRSEQLNARYSAPTPSRGVIQFSMSERLKHTAVGGSSRGTNAEPCARQADRVLRGGNIHCQFDGRICSNDANTRIRMPRCRHTTQTVKPLCLVRLSITDTVGFFHTAKYQL